jgi:hypothetical protein
MLIAFSFVACSGKNGNGGEDTGQDADAPIDLTEATDPVEEDMTLDPSDPLPDGDLDSPSDWSLDEWDAPITPEDYLFIVPYEETPTPSMETTVHPTDIQIADFFFLVDNSDVMDSGYLSNLQTVIATYILPAINTLVPDAMFGVGEYCDYPVSPFGSTTSAGSVFELLEEMTSSVGTVSTAIGDIDTQNCGDASNSEVPALWATATGLGLGSYVPATTACYGDDLGYPCFRPTALPVVLLYASTTFHNGSGDSDPYSGITPTPPTYSEMIDELNAIGAKVISVRCSSRSEVGADLEQIATDTGAVDASGSPIMETVTTSGVGMGFATEDAVEALILETPMDISVIAIDDTSDSVDATVFIDRIEPNTAGGIADPEDSSLVCVGSLATEDSDGDTVHDSFDGLTPGTVVCFDIYPATNETVAATSEPQLFMVTLNVLGHGVSLLDSKDIYFLVPPL